MHDSELGSKSAKPPGVTGASIFSFVGDVAPADLSLWKFEGNITRLILDVKFDSTNAPGAKIFLTAF